VIASRQGLVPNSGTHGATGVLKLVCLRVLGLFGGESIPNLGVDSVWAEGWATCEGDSSDDGGITHCDLDGAAATKTESDKVDTLVAEMIDKTCDATGQGLIGEGPVDVGGSRRYRRPAELQGTPRPARWWLRTSGLQTP
jgi:hypothetical protein